MGLFKTALPFRIVLVWMLSASALCAGSWEQFRGANATGVAVGDQPLPTEFDDELLFWKTALPPGRSSPVIANGRIYLTAARDRVDLFTICLDQATGEVLWEQPAPITKLLALSLNGGQAQSSCAANDQYVVSYFGSSGLICYDRDGSQIWHKEIPPINTQFGTGSSPILVDEWVIVSQDSETDSFLMAVNLADGEEIWKTQRPLVSSSFATPVIWDNAGKRQVVVAGSLRAAGYDLETGAEAWSVRGLSWCVVSTPVVGGDGVLYVNATSPGEGEGVIILEPFDEALAASDRDGDGAFNRDEFEEFGPRANHFPTLDRDKDGLVVREEYDYINRLWTDSQNVMLAIKPGGEGDITDSHVAWTQTKSLPFVTSPIYFQGHLFTVRDSGIVNCVNAESGKQTKQGRLSSRGDFYSSPVAGDGKVYFASSEGDVSVVSAQPKWREIGHTQFDEEIYATPALLDGRVYLRTANHLYCYGYKDPEAERERRAAAIPARTWWALGVVGVCLFLGVAGWGARAALRR